MILNRFSYYAGIVLLGLAMTSSVFANLMDSSFENAINPLPGISTVLTAPTYAAGFWAAESGGEVTADRGVTPLHLNHMLYMNKIGNVATQTFQAIDVNSLINANFLINMIDSGNAVAVLSSNVNTHVTTTNLGFQHSLHFHDVNPPSAWNNGSNVFFPVYNLDTNLNTWENVIGTAPVPIGTRKIIVQLLYVNSSMPAGSRGYVDAVSLTIVPEPSTLTFLAGGLLPLLLTRSSRRKSHALSA